MSSSSSSSKRDHKGKKKASESQSPQPQQTEPATTHGAISGHVSGGQRSRSALSVNAISVGLAKELYEEELANPKFASSTNTGPCTHVSNRATKAGHYPLIGIPVEHFRKMDPEKIAQLRDAGSDVLVSTSARKVCCERAHGVHG